MFERYTAATDGSRSIHRLVDLNGDAGKLTGGVFHDVTEIHYDVQASDYPSDGQLQQVHSGTKPAERKLQATYLYYLHGPLKRIELADQLQGIDFVYNINGSLKSINHADPAQDPG